MIIVDSHQDDMKLLLVSPLANLGIIWKQILVLYDIFWLLLNMCKSYPLEKSEFRLQPGSCALRGSHEVTSERRSWSPTSSGHVPRLARDGPKLNRKGGIWTFFHLSNLFWVVQYHNLGHPLEDPVMHWKNMADDCSSFHYCSVTLRRLTT